MYDLVPNLREENKELYSTCQKFWVGVIEGMCPSPPVPRRKTNCYVAAPVYIHTGHKVFAMEQKDRSGKLIKAFYQIPERELIFVR